MNDFKHWEDCDDMEDFHPAPSLQLLPPPGPFDQNTQLLLPGKENARKCQNSQKYGIIEDTNALLYERPEPVAKVRSDPCF